MDDTIFLGDPIKKDNGGIRGSLLNNGAHFAYSINEEVGVNHNYRGRMVIVGDTGEVIKSKDGKYINKSFYLMDLDDDNLKIKLIEVATELYKINMLAIEANAIAACKPDTISFAVAASRFGKEFAFALGSKSKTADGTERARKNKLSRLVNICTKLPNRPIKDITVSTASQCLKYEKNEDIKLIYDFSEWLINHQYCIGYNPITKPISRKIDKRKSASKRESILDVLTPEMQDDIYSNIEESPSGYAMGIALLLGSGESEEDILTYTWSNLIFTHPVTKQEEDGFALLHVRYPRNYPIVDGSKVICPWAAEILKARHNSLLDKYGSIVNNWKIVSKQEEPMVGLSAPVFRRAIKNRIYSVLTKNKDLQILGKGLGDNIAALLRNTYRYNILARLNFRDNPEIAAFLLRTISWDDTTSMHYISFTSCDSICRYYEAMKILAKRKILVENNDEICFVSKTEDNVTAIITPQSNHDYCGCYATLVLNPGEKLSIESYNGVSGPPLIVS